MSNKPALVITRPKAQGVKLQQALRDVGIESRCQPLFDYQLNTNANAITEQLTNFSPDLIIFVSVAAVTFANQAQPLTQWILPSTTVIAVGEATQQALAKYKIVSVCPEVHDSEGMLALTQVQKIMQKPSAKVLIVRGNGGREYLAQQLTEQGAEVQYLESYQRVWLALAETEDELWQRKNVAGFIITSNALLQRVVDLIDINDNYWQNTCLWIVASERIKQSALTQGLKKVVNSQGANDQAIVETLQNMEFDHD